MHTKTGHVLPGEIDCSNDEHPADAIELFDHGFVCTLCNQLLVSAEELGDVVRVADIAAETFVERS